MTRYSRTNTYFTIRCAMLGVFGVLATSYALAGSFAEDIPALGYSPQNMDRTIDPRQDFYRYAAGNWLKKTDIGPSDPDVGGFTLLGRNLDKQLLSLMIKEAAASANAPKGSARQQVGDFYKAAMDNERRQTLGLKPLEPDLKRIAVAGSSPVDYGRLAAQLQDTVGGSPLIMVGAMPDAKDSSTGVMMLGPGAQLLEQEGL